MSIKQLLIDLNTQRDFLCRDGAVKVVNRIQVLPAVRAIIRWARIQQVPIVSTIEAHRPNETTNTRPRHCIDGSLGQRKLPFTLLPGRILVEADNTHALPTDLLSRYRQIIFRKRTADLLANPKADRLLSHLDVENIYVFGMTVETSVKPLVLGLLARNRPVSVIADACGWWDPLEADLAFRQMATKGARLIQTADLVGQVASPSRPGPAPRRLSRRRARA